MSELAVAGRVKRKTQRRKKERRRRRRGEEKGKGMVGCRKEGF